MDIVEGTRPTRRCDVCDRQHRRWHTQAKRWWPRAIGIIGSGRYATVAHCVARRASDPYFGSAYRDSQTVMLHATRIDAEHTQAFIDATGCGGVSYGYHRIVDLASVEWRRAA